MKGSDKFCSFEKANYFTLLVCCRLLPFIIMSNAESVASVPVKAKKPRPRKQQGTKRQEKENNFRRKVSRLKEVDFFVQRQKELGLFNNPLP